MAAAAIVAGAVLAARGRAGEMAMFLPDAAVFGVGEVTPPEVAGLRPPLSLWGYNAAATDDALQAIAQAMTARDMQIAALRRALAEAQAGPGVPASSAAGWAGQADQPDSAGPAAQTSDADPASGADPASPADPPGQADQPGRAGPGAWQRPERGARE